MNMAFNRFLTRQQVIEAYQVPKTLEFELFAVLRPVFGSGEDARYLESQVDEALKQWSPRKGRPASEDTEFSQEEERNVIAINGANDPWTRIAEGIERLIDVLNPKEPPTVSPSIQVLTPHEAAKKMRVNSQTVMKWCRQGKLGVKAGRKWLITPDEVDRYLRGVLLTKGPKAVAG
jgi:excisionase family DNA binding protein